MAFCAGKEEIERDCVRQGNMEPEHHDTNYTFGREIQRKKRELTDELKDEAVELVLNKSTQFLKHRGTWVLMQIYRDVGRKSMKLSPSL